jgi:hypothetical protein
MARADENLGVWYYTRSNSRKCSHLDPRLMTGRRNWLCIQIFSDLKHTPFQGSTFKEEAARGSMGLWRTSPQKHTYRHQKDPCRTNHRFWSRILISEASWPTVPINSMEIFFEPQSFIQKYLATNLCSFYLRQRPSQFEINSSSSMIMFTEICLTHLSFMPQ